MTFPAHNSYLIQLKTHEWISLSSSSKNKTISFPKISNSNQVNSDLLNSESTKKI